VNLEIFFSRRRPPKNGVRAGAATTGGRRQSDFAASPECPAFLTQAELLQVYPAAICQRSRWATRFPISGMAGGVGMIYDGLLLLIRVFFFCLWELNELNPELLVFL
jgi:hypothetical protein